MPSRPQTADVELDSPPLRTPPAAESVERQRAVLGRPPSRDGPLPGVNSGMFTPSPLRPLAASNVGGFGGASAVSPSPLKPLSLGSISRSSLSRTSSADGALPRAQDDVGPGVNILRLDASNEDEDNPYEGGGNYPIFEEDEEDDRRASAVGGLHSTFPGANTSSARERLGSRQGSLPPSRDGLPPSRDGPLVRSLLGTRDGTLPPSRDGRLAPPPGCGGAAARMMVAEADVRYDLQLVACRPNSLTLRLSAARDTGGYGAAAPSATCASSRGKLCGDGAPASRWSRRAAAAQQDRRPYVHLPAGDDGGGAAAWAGGRGGVARGGTSLVASSALHSSANFVEVHRGTSTSFEATGLLPATRTVSASQRR